VALQIDEHTAQVTATSDPLPQILQGIPISYRDIDVEIDRPEFGLNPTSCDVMNARGTAQGAQGSTAALSSRFQASGCPRLDFKPKLKLRLGGSIHRAGDPALSATLTMPSKGANIAWSRVVLPRGEQIDNAHINIPCTRVQFRARECPPKSILGAARAVSPLLDRPLEGPVYFRSNGGARELPDIVADLRGQIHVVLIGFIDSKKRRIRTTFGLVPDAPIKKFSLKLFGGKRGLLENNRNLCHGSNRAKVQFNGQNGKVSDSLVHVAVPGCGGSHK
jgi:hypothetical protein